MPKRTPHVTEAELRIMKVLWKRGAGTVRQVLDALPETGDEPPAYTTVMTLMKQLAEKRPDLVIKKANINQPGVNGIDWRSPLAQQYQIRQVPYFMIFNPQGQLVVQGREAFETVGRWLKEAGLMQ